MPGLIIVVVARDPQRFHGALSLAAANAALGQRSRVFLQGDAASLLGDTGQETDEHYVRHGIPTLNQLFEEAKALGVEIILCQSGLALAGLQASELPDGVSTGGLVELLASRGQDQLMMA